MRRSLWLFDVSCGLMLGCGAIIAPQIHFADLSSQRCELTHKDLSDHGHLTFGWDCGGGLRIAGAAEKNGGTCEGRWEVMMRNENLDVHNLPLGQLRPLDDRPGDDMVENHFCASATELVRVLVTSPDKRAAAR